MRTSGAGADASPDASAGASPSCFLKPARVLTRPAVNNSAATTAKGDTRERRFSIAAGPGKIIIRLVKELVAQVAKDSRKDVETEK